MSNGVSFGGCFEHWNIKNILKKQSLRGKRSFINQATFQLCTTDWGLGLCPRLALDSQLLKLGEIMKTLLMLQCQKLFIIPHHHYYHSFPTIPPLALSTSKYLLCPFQLGFNRRKGLQTPPGWLWDSHPTISIAWKMYPFLAS